jgi:hypothetical protein
MKMCIKDRQLNLILIVLLISITAFTAFHEGYFPLISIPFLILLLAGFSIAVWLSKYISTKRLIAFILGIFIIEYFKETIGIRSGIWTYHGIDGQYNFGVWSWVLGGLVTYTLSTRIVMQQIRKLNRTFPRWLNQIILTLLFLFILLSLGDYRDSMGVLFYSFYALLFAVTFYASLRIDFCVFAGIIVSAWIIGNPSEYIGSVASGVWTFTHNPVYPPFFLVFGCWPLEILAQYSLSALLANESLNNDNFLT